MTELAKYEAARHALQQAHRVDEVKEIRDKAQAMLAYAKQAKDMELIWIATEIKIRAERKCGELTQELPKIQGKRTSPYDVEKSKAQILQDAGISTQAASRYERLAAIPERKFEQAIAAAKEIQAEVTTAAMLRLDKPHVANNSGENEWYTPATYVEAARSAMGGIDCDPASSKLANKTVQAELYFTAEENGLEQSWSGRVWMNPPYAQPLCQQFCSALVSKYTSKEIEQACALVNNATETVWFQEMLAACTAVCFIKGRVKFIDMNGSATGTPLQGQAILYFGNRAMTFKKNFQDIGLVLIPA